MTTTAWASIEDAFPPLYETVLVSGGTDDPAEPGAVHVAACLVDAWEASEAAGEAIEVWADDEFHDPLPFDVTHWRVLPASAAAGVRSE